SFPVRQRPTANDQKLDLQFILRPRRLQTRLGSQIENELFELQALGGRIGAECQVRLGKQADGAGEFTLRLVAPRLPDDVFGGKRRHAESVPQGSPQGALVAYVALKNH